MSSKQEKTFSSEIVAHLLASIMKSTKRSTLPVDFKFMSQLSGGEFTSAALEHQFRTTRARAKHLLEVGLQGNTGSNVAPEPAVSTTGSKPTRKKRSAEKISSDNDGGKKDNSEKNGSEKPNNQPDQNIASTNVNIKVEVKKGEEEDGEEEEEEVAALPPPPKKRAITARLAALQPNADWNDHLASQNLTSREDEDEVDPEVEAAINQIFASDFTKYFGAAGIERD